jgi:hypothetical protein
MKQVIRKKPTGEVEHWKIRTFSYNDLGEVSIVYSDESGKERLLCLHENEARRLIRFIKEKIQ